MLCRAKKGSQLKGHQGMKVAYEDMCFLLLFSGANVRLVFLSGVLKP